MGGILFLVVVIQAIFILCPLYYLWKVIRQKPLKFSWIIPVYETLISVLMIICFLNFDMPESPFRNEKYFFEFMIISFSSLIFYYINKMISYEHYKAVKTISVAFVGALWWITVLTTFKFLPMAILSFFPILGLLLAAPFILMILTSIEIIRIKREIPVFSFSKIILTGLIIIILFQLFMNVWTVDDWELFKIFNPNLNAIYF